MNLVLLTEDQPFYKALDPISEAVKFLGEFNIWTILIRIFLALLIGTIFGLERSRKRHTAGLRTFTFVSLFSAAAALLDIYFMSNFKVVFPVMTSAVVLGGAIISGNTLLYSSKSQIKGLTTAVALWLIGIVGACFGAGLYTVALIIVVLAYISLNIMPKVEIILKNRL